MKKLILTFLFAILLVSTISAAEFDNVYNYNKDTGIVDIRNSILGIPFLQLDKLADIELKQYTTWIEAGKDKLLAVIKVDLYENYEYPFKTIYFENLKNGARTETRDYDLKLKKITGTKEVPIYEYVCRETGKINATGQMGVTCAKEQTGIRTDDVFEWIDFDYSNLEIGSYEIGLFTDVRDGERGDWKIEWFGVEIKEWTLFEDAAAYIQTAQATESTGSGGNNIIAEQFKVTTTFNLVGIQMAMWDIAQGGVNHSFRIADVNASNGVTPDMSANLSINNTALSGIAGTPTHYNISMPPYAFTADTNYSLIMYRIDGGGDYGRYNLGDANVSHCPALSADKGHTWTTYCGTFDMDIIIYGKTSSAVPTISLNAPANASVHLSSNVTVNCSGSDDVGLYNLSLYVDGSLNTTVYNTTTNQTFLSLQENLDGLSVKTYNWTCFAYDDESQINIPVSNYTFNSSQFLENSITYNTQTTEGSIENFILNITLASPYLISSANLSYNHTFYPSTVDNYGSRNYLVSNSLTIPSINANTNSTFYWDLLLNDGSRYNTTSNSQEVFKFNIGNCSNYGILLLNYTLYDEDELTLIANPPTNNLTIEVSLVIYSEEGDNITSYASNFSTNNAQICVGNSSLGNSTYYMDVITRCDGGSDYISEFNHIQHFLLLNTTIPQHISLYDLLTARSQEFLITFKDDNFIRKGDVIVDLSRKYISDGLFRSVEVALTDTNGETLLHLVLGDVIYTLTFKQNGEVLAILDNFLARCDDASIGACKINVNAFSSTLPIDEFNYINGVSYSESFDERIITTIFSAESGTKTMSLNATKFDRFGNQTICSDMLISSSGTLSCTIPDSFGNVTVISTLYADGVIISQKTYSVKEDLSGTYGGSIVILALMIIITLSMMFIASIEGILLGAFLGLVLSALLSFINLGNMFFVGASISWILLAVIIIIWKIAHKEEQR
jgi:hypothetical protein